MIHIEETLSRDAAKQICEILAERRVPFLVWSLADEGFAMVHARSPQAKAVQRYYPEAVAGVFERVTAEELRPCLMMARFDQAIKASGRTDERRAYEAERKRRLRAEAKGQARVAA